VTRADQFILDWWAENASEPAGAAELDRLQYALLERFGDSMHAAVMGRRHAP